MESNPAPAIPDDRASAAAPVSIGERIVRLAASCRERDTTLQDLVDKTDGRSFLVLMFLTSLPFCQPIPLFGLSTPFGLLHAFLGWRMMTGKELRLPERMKGIVIPKKFFPTLLNGAGRLLRWLERRLRPQWPSFIEPAWVRRACGANIFACALLLSLPLPIPFSNIFPAIPIMLSTAALIESDGKMLARAAVAAAANLVFWSVWLVLVCLYGWVVVEKASAWMQGALGF